MHLPNSGNSLPCLASALPELAASTSEAGKVDEQTFYIRLASTSQQKVNEARKLHLEKPKKKKRKKASSDLLDKDVKLKTRF